ncbi:MAG: methyltransferase domain-containing protein [Chloroflexota bacterium]
MDATRHNDQVRAQFGAAAEHYVVSETHAGGDDLDQIVAWAEGGADRVALDVATGGGHTALALAPLYGQVVASDLTERMLQSAEAFVRGRGALNVSFRQADAESLPFVEQAFDLVSCRIAPHHFANVARFVSEVQRVLTSGGIFLLEDSIAPEAPEVAEFLNRAESLRDHTHIRSLRVSEWRNLLREVGLIVEAERVFPKEHPFEAWVRRSQTREADQATLVDLFRASPASARAALRIVVDDAGRVVSYTDEKVVFKARKP